MADKIINSQVLGYYDEKLKIYIAGELEKKADATDVEALEQRVPAATEGESGKFLRGDGTWAEVKQPNNATDEAYGLVKGGGDVSIVDGVITVNDNSHNHTVSNITDLQDTLDGYVPVGTTVNGKPLSDDIVLSVADIEGAVATSELGSSVAPLEDGLIPSQYLPSYVDDVVEADNHAALPESGESGKIYVTIDDGKTYRWGGTSYVEISASIALGETTGTAYDGLKGKTNADNIAALQEAVGSSGSGLVKDVADLTSSVNQLETSLDAAEANIASLQQTIDGIVSVGGEANVINEIQLNGTKIEPSNKVVNIVMEYATNADVDALFAV